MHIGEIARCSVSRMKADKIAAAASYKLTLSPVMNPPSHLSNCIDQSGKFSFNNNKETAFKYVLPDCALFPFRILL